MRGPDVHTAVPSWPRAVKKQPMAVTRKGRAKLHGRSVDDRSKILGRFPGIIHAGTMRNPEVIGAVAAGAVRADVETQAVFGKSRMLIIKRAIDYRSQINRLAP